MKIIKYKDTIDVTAYSDYLKSVEGKMPENAYRFASNKFHYDFYSSYCTHDLKFGRLCISYDKDEKLCYEFQLSKNKFKHEKGLIIYYYDVREITVKDKSDDKGEIFVDELIIDELFYDEKKKLIIHELQFIYKEVIILCKDVDAQWI